MIGAMGCHQIPERSFRFRGLTMPLCARCLGAGIGHVASVLLFAFGVFPPLWMDLTGMCVIYADWALQEYAGVMSSNPRRLVTGLFGGFGVGCFCWLIVSIVWRWFWSTCII